MSSLHLRKSVGHSILVFSALIALCCTSTWAISDSDYVFTSPAAGTHVRVGQKLRIAFEPTMAGLSTSRDILRFSSDNGFTWKSFISLNGDDTVSIKRHLDWVVPFELGGLLTSGDSCLVSLWLYEPRKLRGTSATFTVEAVPESVTVVTPAAGSVYHVGDPMRIEFTVASPVHIGSQALGISVDSGKTYAVLVVMDGTDTVSTKHHYDWVLPAAVDDLTGANHIADMVSTACRVRIAPVEESGSTLWGASGVFRIEPPLAVTNPLVRRAPDSGSDNEQGGLCGNGAGLALMPPLLMKLAARRRRRTQ